MSTEFKATAAASGIAIAPVLHMRNYGEFIPTNHVGEHEVELQCERFEQAVTGAAAALEELAKRLEGQIAATDSGIYSAQRALLLDPGLSKDVLELIRSDKVNAEQALQRVIAKYQEAFAEIDNVAFRERASDIRDVGRQVLNFLLQKESIELLGKDEDYILAIDEFLPSDLGSIDSDHVRGILMGEGGKYSHGAILAKSLGIPCLVGLAKKLVRVPTGKLAILDGDSGKLIVDPDEGALEEYRKTETRRAEAESRIFEVRLSPPLTKDDVKIDFYANIEGLREVASIEPGTFKGIGLFRTEFAFMERLQFPSEEEQYQLYSEVLETFGGRVTFRTLDVGGDKPLQYFSTPNERNPVLGWRGLRLTLSWPDILLTQMRALVRASRHGPVQILLPMVTTLAEVRRCRAMLDRILGDMAKAGEEIGEVSFGVMIEVPALARKLAALLDEVDFVSVGSNDLTQYLLAVDRDNPRVAGMYDPCHPGVVLALADIARVSTRAGVPCSLCGELAGDTEMIPLLIGMGYRKFSMAPVFLPRVKLAVRSLHASKCEALFERVRAAASADEVRAMVREMNEAISLEV